MKYSVKLFLMALGIITTSHIRISCHILNIPNLYKYILVWPVFAFIMAQRRFWIWSFHSHTVTLCHTVSYFATLCQAWIVTLCHAGQNWTFAWEGKVTSRKMVTITFWGQVSNLLNKINRFSTAGEVRGISMKIGIGEIYKKKKNNYLTSSKKLCIWIVVKF